MLNNKKKQSLFWDVQVSIAKAAAKLPNPSIMKLHHEILEEIGQPPGLDLIDYFVSIAEVTQEEIAEYFLYIGKSEEKPKKNTKSTYKAFAKKIAREDKPTVLKFRQEFIRKNGKSPSDELVFYFLEHVQKGTQKKKINDDSQNQLNFAETIARSATPTVLKFRKEYTKQFGSPPSGEITEHFLKKLQEAPSIKERDEDFQSKLNFAKTVANGLIPTILQFRQAYEKAYGESPTADIVNMYVKHLPRRGAGSN